MRPEFRRGSARDILRSDEALALVARAAERVQASAGPGFEVRYRVGRNRARASVYADTFSARVRNSRENILIRALGSGRG